MASNISYIEEVPRKDLTVPQIRLKIIHLNLDDRGRSLTPPPLPAGEGSSTVQRYTRQPLLRRRLHKLNSYGHLLNNVQHDSGLEHHTEQRKRNTTTYSQRSFKNNNSDTGYENMNTEHPHEDDSVFMVFVKGMNNYLCADRDKIINTVVHLLNKHAVSVATKEHLLFANRKDLPPKSTLNHMLVKGALLIMNELLDQGVLDISQRGVVQVGQCLTFSLYFQKNLQQLSRNAWNSSYAQVIRDAWMSFGCLGAVLLISSMRQ